MDEQKTSARVGCKADSRVRRFIYPLEDSRRDTSNDWEWKSCPRCAERSDAWKLFCWKCDHAFKSPNPCGQTPPTAKGTP